jgi:dienelactone hydrolase
MASLTIASAEPGRPFDSSSVEPLPVEFVAEMDGRTIASAQVCRHYVADGVRTTVLRGSDRSGLLFEPDADGPRPAVMVVGGSSGGLVFASQVAALLASHGFVGLALAYFNHENLPPHLIDIPIEYFSETIAWLSSQSSVRKESIGVMGISRGAELALILGARSSSIRSVVAYSPSSVVWSGLRGDVPSDKAAWAMSGVPIPYSSLMSPRLAAIRSRVFETSPVELTPMFEAAMAGPLPAESFIPVEKTKGPILLVSGEDDRMWPSTRMGAQIMERLRTQRHPFPSRHLHFPGAGHLMRSPGVSTRVLHGKFAFGGESTAQAKANRTAWAATLSFLAETLRLDANADALAAAGGQR